MKIDDLPSTFLLPDKQVKRLNSLPYKIVKDHVQVLKHNGHFYHLNPDLVFDVDEIVLCPVCAIDPMMKSQTSIAAGNDYGWLAHLKPLNGTTRNACVPVWLYNINLQICENHSTNHSIAFPMDGPVECLKVLPCVDINHCPHVTFLGPQHARCKNAHKYKHLFKMDTKLAYDWLTFWVNANYSSFKECTIDESEDAQTRMNNVTNNIVQEAITTENPDIVGMSIALDAEDEEDTSGMNNIDHKSASPYMIHTAVLPKPSLINENINAAIDALCKIVQPEDNNSEYINHLDDDIPCNTDSNFRPVIPVSRESNEPIVEWTDNDKLLRGAQIYFCLDKVHQINYQLTNTGNILHYTMMVDLTICCL
jgi:hypothetical protein